MVVNVSESGVLLESPAPAAPPLQAFAISLSGSVIEDMIACVQNGGDIQLALGSSPVSIEALWPVPIVVVAVAAAIAAIERCCTARTHNSTTTTTLPNPANPF
jgi:hypothetical protein